MFKYGSFKLFFIKFSLGRNIFGYFFIFFDKFAHILHVNDPGFKTFQRKSNENIKIFWDFGAYLSSYSFSYYWSFFNNWDYFIV